MAWRALNPLGNMWEYLFGTALCEFYVLLKDAGRITLHSPNIIVESSDVGYNFDVVSITIFLNFCNIRMKWE